MWSVEVLDAEIRIIQLVWDRMVSPAEIQAANAKIAEVVRILGNKSFDLLVDMRTVVAFPPESQQELVRHQQWLLEVGMRRAAVVISGPISKMQLDRTRRASGHEQEFKFNTKEDALAFLKS